MKALAKRDTMPSALVALAPAAPLALEAPPVPLAAPLSCAPRGRRAQSAGGAVPGDSVSGAPRSFSRRR